MSTPECYLNAIENIRPYSKRGERLLARFEAASKQAQMTTMDALPIELQALYGMEKSITDKASLLKHTKYTKRYGTSLFSQQFKPSNSYSAYLDLTYGQDWSSCCDLVGSKFGFYNTESSIGLSLKTYRDIPSKFFFYLAKNGLDFLVQIKFIPSSYDIFYFEPRSTWCYHLGLKYDFGKYQNNKTLKIAESFFKRESELQVLTDVENYDGE